MRGDANRAQDFTTVDGFDPRPRMRGDCIFLPHCYYEQNRDGCAKPFANRPDNRVRTVLGAKKSTDLKSYRQREPPGQGQHASGSHLAKSRQAGDRAQSHSRSQNEPAASSHDQWTTEIGRWLGADVFHATLPVSAKIIVAQAVEGWINDRFRPRL